MRAAVDGLHPSAQLDLTPTRLAALGKQIELLSGRRAPSLIKQKRDFILAWWRLALARHAHTALIHSPSPQPSARRVEVNPLYADTASRGRSHEALQRLLAEYSTPDAAPGGTMELRVPVEQLQIVCTQVENLTGTKAPRQPRARREWLASLIDS